MRLQAGGTPWEPNVLNLPDFEDGFEQAIADTLAKRERTYTPPSAPSSIAFARSRTSRRSSRPDARLPQRRSNRVVGRRRRRAGDRLLDEGQRRLQRLDGDEARTPVHELASSYPTASIPF